MPIEVYPAPVTSSINASSITATSSNTFYEATISLSAAVYTVTCVSTSIASLEFYSGSSTLIASGATVSGTVTINIPSDISKIRLWTDTGSNVVITITKIASIVSKTSISGTLDTITSTGTYTGTSTSGYGYAMVAGAGGGGGGGAGGAGAGGGSGGAGAKLIELTGSLSVTIGTGGNGGVGGYGTATAGNAGGATNFGGITANGGNGGQPSAGGGGSGGTSSGGTWNVNGLSGTSVGGVSRDPGGTSVTASSAIIAGGYSYSKGGSGGDYAGQGNANSTGLVGLNGVVYILRF